MKLNRYALKRLEGLVKDQGYRLIYEKGSFDSSHCLVHAKKYVVVNKFLEVEQRVLALKNIIDEINADISLWSESNQKWYQLFLNSIENNNVEA